jgi:hypothetical protein
MGSISSTEKKKKKKKKTEAKSLGHGAGPTEFKGMT